MIIAVPPGRGGGRGRFRVEDHRAAVNPFENRVNGDETAMTGVDNA
ncbi:MULTISPECIES: hypothetical protein [Actinomadura]|uniref:Uncharacterized protein n=1 Tax=Actinomadura livida TaxID=79909 RepID=A0A7W7IE31_9ACTN|nr:MULTISPECIES: hypothetical protein [Actinomadura]MBB4775214.1 hypothetical protein [Actinomadura catellatispora]GGT88679.1 hypothetical protein GCM10010208_09280 [Actinomadura livida]